MFGAFLASVNPANAFNKFLKDHQADVVKCTDKKEPPHANIEGCTALLKANDAAGQLSPRQVVSILIKRAIAYAKNSDHAKALADVDRALGLSSHNSQLFFLRGNILLNSGKNKQAAAQFTKVIELNPKIARAYYLRARAYTLTGKTDWALKDIEKAMELAPQQMVLPAYRAKLYTNMGEHQKALKDLDNILVYQPRNPTALRLKAMVLISSRDNNIRDVKNAVALAHQSFLLKQSNSATNVLAMAYVADGQNDMAMKLYDQGLKNARPPRIKLYQNYLHRQGHYSGPFDGTYSPALRKAVQACLKEQCFKLFE
jgi:tetratricopeptide (TPR) repeat protein